MRFNRPSRAKLDERITSDFEYEMGSQAPGLPDTIERAFVRASGGVVHGLYGRLENIYRSFFPHLADEAGVVKMAALFGLTRTPATRARGEILLSGLAGTVVPAATARWVRSDGVVYRILEDFELTGSPGEAVHGEAIVSGAAGNCKAGTKLTLQSAIDGLNSAAEVGVVFMDGGLDREDWRALLVRLLERLDEPGNGGGPGSYRRWTKLVPGVTRVWEFGKVTALGHVTVLFMRDGDADPFPNDLRVAEVKAKILEFAPLHLAGLHVQAPIEKAISMTIEITPDTPEMRAAAVVALQRMLANRARPPAEDGVVFYKSNFHDALADVAGLDDYKITVPAGDVTVDQFELLTLTGAGVTWI